MSSAGILNLPITALPVDNFHDRVLWCKSTGINYNMHGWILCRYCATGWFWWISGLRAVTMWSSSSFTKTDRHQRSRTIQPTTANRRGCEISPLAWLHQALGYIYSLFVLRKHRWVGAKKDVTPLLTHWSYIFLALTHRHGIMYSCTGSWVNDNYQRISSCDGAWFRNLNPWLSVLVIHVYP